MPQALEFRCYKIISDTQILCDPDEAVFLYAGGSIYRPRWERRATSDQFRNIPNSKGGFMNAGVTEIKGVKTRYGDDRRFIISGSRRVIDKLVSRLQERYDEETDE